MTNSDTTASSVTLHDGDDTSSNASSFPAPLGDAFSEISIDRGSVRGDPADDAVRPAKPEEVSEEDRADALRIKAEANRLFAASDYQTSLDLYTLALNRNPFDCTVWCNRSAVCIKREEFGLAVSDATKAIELKGDYVKAFWRRAVANLAIMQPKSSLADFRKIVALDPKNASARAQLDSTQKLVNRLNFEKAISSKGEEPVSSKLKKLLTEGMPVEDDYEGPLLPESSNDKAAGAKITEEFVNGMITHFKNGKLLPKRIVWQIALGCQRELLKHKSLVEIQIPEGGTCDVIGDTHGQFFDVCHLLTLTGPPSPNHTLVVNGDYVDRGSWSTETVLVWFAYKWLYPQRCFLNRGNHETSDMNKVYGFEGETKKKYDERTYRLFEEVFAALPIATLVSASKTPTASSKSTSLFSLRRELPPPTLGPNGTKRYFVVHGGIFSRDEVGLDEVRKIDRLSTKQPAGDSTFGEALWADPQDAPGRGPSKRGVGKAFGPDITRAFCERNQVTAIIRSHEVRQEGYSIEHDGLCITVFSAPNYVDQVGNLACFVRISDDGSLNYETFSAQPHPPIRPLDNLLDYGFRKISKLDLLSRALSHSVLPTSIESR